MKRKRRRTLKYILLGLNIVLAAVLVWIIVTQVRESNEIIPAAQREAGDWKVLSDAVKEETELVITEAKEAVAAARLEAEKKQAEAEAEAGKLKKPDDVEDSNAGTASSSTVNWNDAWQYAQFSAIHSGSSVLYRAPSNRKGITVAINAGHGTSGGQSVKTQCHPDGSAKVTGGSTAAGSTTAVAVSSGTTLNDGTSEADATLALAKAVRQELLAAGYDVLMIRDGSDVQLDNVARTVMANNNADCHISLHYDSTQSDKGLFYTSVPNIGSYRSMEPVASHWQQHHALGESVLAGMRQAGVAIYGGGSMAIDLTQTSYSTIPSIDLEVGDRASDHSSATLQKIGKGIAAGVDNYF